MTYEVQETARLKAENERLHALVRDISATRDTAVNMHLADTAEIGRMAADIDKLMSERDGWLQEIERLTALIDAEYYECPHCPMDGLILCRGPKP